MPLNFPGRRIIFLGNPFRVEGRRKFPFPLLWTPEERSWHPTTRVLNCWKRLNEFDVSKLRPALSEYEIVFTERFGLDAALYATACCDSDVAIDEAERVHRALVRMRIVEQGIDPPTYFIPSANSEDTEGLMRAFPPLHETNPETLRRFMAHEARMLERYFDPQHGQKTPCLLPATMTIDEMVGRAIEVVGDHLQRRAAA